MREQTKAETVDARFVEAYERERSALIEQQKRDGLIVVNGDLLTLYHGNAEPTKMSGLEPALYNKLKTIGHVPMAIFCFLLSEVDEPSLSRNTAGRLSTYATDLEAARRELDTSVEVLTGILKHELEILPQSISFIRCVLSEGRVGKAAFEAFERSVTPDIQRALAGAARAQVDACHERVMRIKKEILDEATWSKLCVLVLGPYMARRGELFLQYFSKLLNTSMYGDRRVVYFEGEDLDLALDRLGTTILDAHASLAIFADRDRLHRDVLADSTAAYLSQLSDKH